MLPVKKSGSDDGAAIAKARLNVFALDFDGVICDSALECAVAAWRAGQFVWPDWHGDSPPRAFAHRFRDLRPVIETGYQCILLMRLIAEHRSDSDILRRFDELSEELLKRCACPREQLIAWFDETRDRWLQEDERSWLHYHRFYPHVFETFVATTFRSPVFIVTTKQERYVDRLLAQQGIYFPPRHLFGLESGRTKEQVLSELVNRLEYRNAAFHFVEDRLATLLRIAMQPELEKVQLYLAQWGYNTAQDRRYAAMLDRITIWNEKCFMKVNGSGTD